MPIIISIMTERKWKSIKTKNEIEEEAVAKTFISTIVIILILFLYTLTQTGTDGVGLGFIIFLLWIPAVGLSILASRYCFY